MAQVHLNTGKEQVQDTRLKYPFLLTRYIEYIRHFWLYFLPLVANFAFKF